MLANKMKNYEKNGKDNEQYNKLKNKKRNSHHMEVYATTVSDAKDSNKEPNNQKYRAIFEEELNEEDFYYDNLATEISKEHKSKRKNKLDKIDDEEVTHTNMVNVKMTLNILDKAKENRYRTTYAKKEDKPSDFWSSFTSFFQPFKCDK